MGETAVRERALGTGAGAGPTGRLQSGFLASVERFPDRPALEMGGRWFSYREMRARAGAIAATLAAHGAPSLTAIFAHRTVTAFTGILGALLQGHAYLPLNRTLPPARTRLMLERSGARALVVDRESAEQLEEVLQGAEPTLVVAPDESDVAWLAARLPGHRVVGGGDLESADAWRAQPGDPQAMAYLLFTSGSTGVPKGVMVSHRNARHYVECIADRYDISPEDRFSQAHDLTFDNSVLDVYVAWERGACVCCPSARALMKPGGFIREQRLTVWFSVPSIAIFMRRLGELKPGSYPTLRWSLFAGEPLPVEVAQGWLAAAPNSTLENLYGPTEVTVDCTVYRFDPQRTPVEAEQGIVPIGHPLPDMTVQVADAALREVPPGDQGELLVAGPQVALGYLEEPERTAVAFLVPPGREEVHYRTGDLVRRPANPDGPLRYLGRIDQQIKVRGVRVELGEVEAALRETTGVDAVLAVGWPRNETGYDGIVAFVGATDVDVRRARALIRERLPAHMVPRRFELLEHLPLNANGKFDRGAVTQQLEREAAR